ncbi:MAG: hypothetical protein L3J15_04250 [Devosiaceae bacterium]|nr:hypothetical protein [Devosiaceae bacterium]
MKISGKIIISKIFALRNILEKSGNESIFQEFGLSVSTYAPLKMVALGLSTISQMKEISTETIASLGQKIQKLENLGLVIRELDEKDKRKWNFQISTKGANILQKVEKRFDEVGDDILSDFSEKEKENLWQLLEKIEINLEL